MDDIQTGAPFYGADYDHKRDHKRLTGQLLRVWDVFKDGQWHTLREIAEKADAPEASVSAQLRHLRRAEYGGHVVEKEFVRDGLYRYRLGRERPEQLPHPGDTPYERTVKSLQKAGHGHVVARLDGQKTRCGGAGLCRVCQQEKAYLDSMKTQ